MIWLLLTIMDFILDDRFDGIVSWLTKLSSGRLVSPWQVVYTLLGKCSPRRPCFGQKLALLLISCSNNFWRLSEHSRLSSASCDGCRKLLPHLVANFSLVPMCCLVLPSLPRKRAFLLGLFSCFSSRSLWHSTFQVKKHYWTHSGREMDVFGL